MKLNLEQSMHLTGTSRIVSVGLFGLYGYPYLLDKGGSLGLLFVAILLSLTLVGYFDLFSYGERK